MISFETAFEKLKLPEFLNGHEQNVVKHIQSNDLATDFEVARRMQDLYDEICAARFALINSCKNEYYDYISLETKFKGHLWVKSQFLNNAILWYNNTYDILLQLLWFHYKLHGDNLCNNNFDQIIKECKKSCRFKQKLENKRWYIHFQTFENKYLIKSSGENTTNLSVRDLANTLKHRRMLRYKELKTSNISFRSISKEQNLKDYFKSKVTDIYDSSKTTEYLSMEKVTNTLFSFHEDLVILTKEITDDILRNN